MNLAESNNGLFFKSISGEIHCPPTIANMFDKRLLPAKFNNGLSANPHSPSLFE